MIDAFSISAAGIQASTRAFEKSAQNVVKATDPSAKDANVDLPTAIVDSKQSEIAFEANTAVFKTADNMLGTLLDTLA